MKKIEMSFLFAVLPSQSAADITRIALSSSNLEKAVTEHINDVQSQTSPPQIIRNTRTCKLFAIGEL
jgi:hypothetical protein